MREHLGLRAGDRMEFILQDGSVVLRPLTRDIRDLKGMLPKPKRAVSVETMNRALRERAARG